MVCISVFLMIKMQSFYFWIFFMAYISNFGGLGAEGVIPGRYIVSLLRVFKQFTHTLPSR